MKLYSVLLATLLLNLFFFSCANSTSENTPPVETGNSVETVLSMLTDTRTTQYFTNDNVPEGDIIQILNAGKSATSGMNSQPWHFGVILNQSMIQRIAATPSSGPAGPPPGAPASAAFPKAGFKNAPAAIAIACTENNDFSAGLATQNMIVAATALGYGTKIVRGGADILNSEENRALLQVPAQMKTIMILIIGQVDPSIDVTADGATGPSPRKSLEEVATIVK
ncbi:nitroreductase family protein [Parabacteroides sp. PF5-9]|uniref:nitroreductase family protein n=1 Tax=Parabacteroides sp. PF5-9 TaxID=1742404 RepID=UPI00247347CD|nr:nitroreductase family protein [Parabacteroides sp. PF5-9]MDH6356344.1 nitroreductase [Parabacteroides sp. PF5-9]